MFYVLDNNEKVIGIIQRNIDNKCKNIYFDDLLQEDLISGAEVLTFSAILEKKLMKEVTPSNYIAFKKDNSYKLMQIVEVEDEKTENGIIKNVYCESAGLELINEIYTGGNMESVNFKMFLSNILQDTFWNIGNIDSSLIKNISLKIEQKSIYNLIQEHSKTFGAEIAFRVEIKNNRVVGRYIDAYVKKGKDIGKRLEIKKDIKSITRKINMIDYATKLIGKGKDGLTFKDIEDISLNKPRGQDFLINEMAYSQLNYKGKHITKVFEYDTTDPRELLLQTKKALDEYSKLKIEYQIDSNIIDYTDIEIGDTLYISDLTFEPSLLVSSRVVKLETSNTNPNTNKLTLSNFKEIKSSISKFPIGSNDILDGAITEGKIDNKYLKTIKTDVIIAAKADVEELIADKADIKDLNAINATIDNLKAKDANIENLVANKADIADLDAVNANIDILQSDMAQIDTLLAGNITADNIQAGSITANEIASGTITAGSGIIADGAIGNAQISSVDAGKINAGTIDTSKVTVVGPNSNLKISGNRLQVFTGIGSDQFERVSLGDVNGDGSIYGFRVRGVDGETILIDENGVKKEGITDGSITNEKISNNANIDGSKLDINSVVRNINKDGTEVIQGTKINVNGTNLETKLSIITQKQTEDSERITQAYSKITANENKINLKVDNQTYQTDKNNINTALNKNTSEISLLKDKIALKVEQTDITNAINNIQVGGRNLFVNSGMFKSGVLSNWINNGGSGLTVENKDGFSCLKATGSYRRPAMTLKANTDYMYWVEIMFDRDVTVNQSAPLHYWFKSMPSGARKEVYIKIIEGSGIAKANTWHKIVLHIKPTPLNSGDNYLELTPFIYKSPMPETWWIKFIKLEEGNKITDWSPAPEDIDTKVTEVKNQVSEITTNINGISSKVETLQQKEIQNRKVGAFRYIKDYLNGSTSNTGNHWVEIQVWANGTNIAQGKTPTTNSARNVQLITDGNTATDHYSDAAGTWAWVQIDLGEIRYDVDMIKVWHYYKDNRAYNNKLMVSMDGQTWYTLFNSEESGRYKENSNGRTYIINESYTETRLKAAEQKITDEAITNTVKQNFYTKGDIDGKGYQTSSQVQQTVNQLQIKFTESGGYNKIRNSKIMETSNGYGFGGRSVDASLMASGNTYTFSVNGRTVNGIGGKYCVIYLYDKDWNWSISISIPETTDTTKSKTFTLPSNILPENLRVSCYHYPNGGDRSGSSRVNWVSITDGTLSHPWSPHPSEIYDGITRIDKDGITVTSSNVKSKTSMTASGFKITKTDTNTDVFKVASDGNLEIQGSIITNSSSGARAELKEDSLRFYNTNNDLAGKMSYLYDPYVPEGNSKEILWVRSASGYALKLESQGANASLEANKVYISAKASDGVIGLNSTKINIDGDLHCGDAIYGQHDLIRLGYHAINFATVGQSKFGYSLKLNNSLIATSENEGNSIHFLCYGSNSMLSAQVYGGGFYARGPISRSLRTINNTTALEEMQNTEVIISDNKRLVIPKRYSRNSKDTSTIGLTKTIDYQTGEENINMDYNTVISTL
ncbi:MAG TPA: hypothetical protein K8U79_00570, partial [Clostridium perfringens]|nr:hypothetical protein [Clostridium perfringens]